MSDFNSIKTLSYDSYKDGGYSFFKPLLDVCIAYEGSGVLDDEETTFAAVVTHPSDKQNALIVTTQRAHDRKSLEIQNLETLLQSKHAIKKLRVIFSSPKDIHAILHDAKNAKNIKSTASDESDSTALKDLENIVTEAVISGTSDIHFYVYEDRGEAVFRVDGIFSHRTPMGREQAIAVIAAGLNTKSPDYRSVTDDNEMADVSIYLTIELPDPNDSRKSKRERINLRTSKSGALEGPHTVMRVIRTSQDAKMTISNLGMDKDIRDMLIASTEAPTGIILITGPTGSGKSTTLAALYETINEDGKIILLEDPVEYKVKRRNTVQKPVFPDLKGLGFTDYLKNALRQDPDIIGISEMRDKEVANIVIKSALTGHLMVSTMHTNDAIGAVSRLIDEGISSKVLAERNLFRCIAAQRLIPALCPKCRIPKPIEGFVNSHVRNEKGCKHCKSTGNKGRVMVSELIMFDDACREFIANYDLAGLEKHLRNVGWKSMSDRARMRIEEGVIDPYEAKRHIANLFVSDTNIKYKDVQFEYSGIEPIEAMA